MLKEVFSKRNILLNIDIEGDGGFIGGGELIPFEELITRDDLKDYYYDFCSNFCCNSFNIILV